MRSNARFEGLTASDGRDLLEPCKGTGDCNEAVLREHGDRGDSNLWSFMMMRRLLEPEARGVAFTSEARKLSMAFAPIFCRFDCDPGSSGVGYGSKSVFLSVSLSLSRRLFVLFCFPILLLSVGARGDDIKTFPFCPVSSIYCCMLPESCIVVQSGWLTDVERM